VIAIGSPKPLPERFNGRPIYLHNEVLAATRPTPEESRQVGALLARKLNAARGPTVLFMPLDGLSMLGTEGQPFHDPEADEALYSTLRDLVDRSKVEVHEVDTEINDPQFALAMAERLHELVTA
jgi:uncharacterized protein (UPF0261 family)